jgi:uncharacterized protein
MAIGDDQRQIAQGRAPIEYRCGMRFSAEVDSTLNFVRAYSTAEIRVRDLVIRSSVILAARELVLDWPPRSVAELREEHLAPLFALRAEVVLLGTGRRQDFPPAAILAAAARAGVGLEIMDTAAACRTYNVLLQEDRRVAAALMLAAEEGPGRS